MSHYGNDFDRLTAEWRVLENRHDRIHPDRSECGGVGRCSLMEAAHDLKTEMLDALDEWRVRKQ